MYYSVFGGSVWMHIFLEMVPFLWRFDEDNKENIVLGEALFCVVCIIMDVASYLREGLGQV